MHNTLPQHSLARRQPRNREGPPQNFHPTQMANSVTRIIFRNGKSFPQLLSRTLVGRPSNVNVCNKDQLSLINPTQQLYLQRPLLGDGFNFVDLVVGKDQELPAEHWKSSAVVKACGNQGRRYDRDDDEEEEDDDDEFDSDEVEDFDDDEDDEVDEDEDRW